MKFLISDSTELPKKFGKWYYFTSGVIKEKLIKNKLCIYFGYTIEKTIEEYLEKDIDNLKYANGKFCVAILEKNKLELFVDYFCQTKIYYKIKNGIDITNLPIYIRSKMGIGYLPQEPSVFRGLTVEENLLSILQYTEPNKSKRINLLEDLLKDFSLIEKRKQNAMNLSGGQRRRVEIARTLCTKPNFILLDEPFTGIDPLQLNEIKNLIKNLKKRNIGVLITDHNVREALTVIDRAYIIHEGNVLMQGKPKDIINNKLVKKFYLGDTFKI